MFIKTLGFSYLFQQGVCIVPRFSFCTLLALTCGLQKFLGSPLSCSGVGKNQFLWLRISFKKVSSPSQTNINGICLLLKYVTFLKSLRDLAFSLMLRKNLIFLNKTKAPAVPPSYYHNNTVWEKVVSNNDCSQTK